MLLRGDKTRGGYFQAICQILLRVDKTRGGCFQAICQMFLGVDKTRGGYFKASYQMFLRANDTRGGLLFFLTDSFQKFILFHLNDNDTAIGGSGRLLPKLINNRASFIFESFI